MCSSSSRCRSAGHRLQATRSASTASRTASSAAKSSTTAAGRTRSRCACSPTSVSWRRRSASAAGGSSAGSTATAAGSQPCELLTDERERRVELHAVRGDIWPAARTRWVRKRDDGNAVALEPAADALGQLGPAEQPRQREPADRDDQLRPQQLELPVPPELAEILLARRRGAVAAARRLASRVAARHRGAEERRVERLLVELEPAAERLACAPPPRQALLALDDAGRLSVHIGALLRERGPDR